MLQNNVKTDMIKAVKDGNTENAQILKYTLGEFSRLKGTKDGKDIVGEVLTDDQALRVIKKIIESERKLLETIGGEDTQLIKVLSEYLPKTLDEATVVSWIKDNVDFSSLKNKMQAVGLIKKEFGNNVDAKMVNNIVQNWEN